MSLPTQTGVRISSKRLQKQLTFVLSAACPLAQVSSAVQEAENLATPDSG